MLQARLDDWVCQQQKAASGGATLGYSQTATTTALLEPPTLGDWPLWAVPNSLRETEPNVNFILDAADWTDRAGPGMEVRFGPSLRSRHHHRRGPRRRGCRGGGRVSPLRAAGKKSFPGRVGGMRPSQLMYSFGVGAMVDLPNFSVIVAGIDDWKTEYAGEIAEERLLTAIRADKGLGLGHVTALHSPPWLEETRSPFEQWAWTGVPVIPFPRWMRCTACNLLTTLDAGLLELSENPFRPDQTRYVHKNCSRVRGNPPTSVPARFVVVCHNGHIDEFPWVEFTHRSTGGVCPSGSWRLHAKDIGAGARSTDMLVTCEACGAKVVMAAAFGENAAGVLPQCRGRHAHIRQFEAGCGEQVRPLLLGASNVWFAATRSVLSIPASSDSVEQAVAECWPKLNAPDAPVNSPEMLRFAVNMVPGLRRLASFEIDEVWVAIEGRRAGESGHAEETDLLGPEWEVFVAPRGVPESRATSGSVRPRGRTDTPRSR